eukprot:SAG11_NODE_4564_length_1849_cov_4.490857_1_plen_137_part_00
MALFEASMRPIIRRNIASENSAAVFLSRGVRCGYSVHRMRSWCAFGGQDTRGGTWGKLGVRYLHCGGASPSACRQPAMVGGTRRGSRCCRGATAWLRRSVWVHSDPIDCTNAIDRDLRRVRVTTGSSCKSDALPCD